jgi:hypothetical protein
MEAASTSETSVTSTRLHGAITHKTAIFKVEVLSNIYEGLVAWTAICKLACVW